MNMIGPRRLEPGIHFGVPADVYHADPCPAPSLSSGIVRLLVQRSARHAWAAHPRLNTMQEPVEPTPAMEEGTLLHSLLLGTPHLVVEVDCDDWRTKAAQAKRDDARAEGAIPVLTWRLAQLERCAAAFREQLADHECAAALTNGEPEATLIWREGEIWCRARPDWLRSERRAPLFDVKTTGESAAPDTWERKLREDYALQAAWYLRGARALGLEPAGFVFLVLETKPPHGFCAFQPANDLLWIAEQQIEEAMQLWATCLEAGAWSGYPRRICHVEAPGWLLARQEERAGFAQQRLAATKPTRAQIEAWTGFMQEGANVHGV